MARAQGAERGAPSLPNYGHQLAAAVGGIHHAGCSVYKRVGDRQCELQTRVVTAAGQPADPASRQVSRYSPKFTAPYLLVPVQLYRVLVLNLVPVPRYPDAAL